MKIHKALRFLIIPVLLTTASFTRAVTVVTLPAVTSNTVATLKGTVNPGGVNSSAWFEWGTAANNYTNTTALTVAGNGSAPVAASNVLSGVTPGRVYHYRIAATNASGVTRGRDMMFGSPAIALIGNATVTNECHTAFTDPGATASGVPLAISGGLDYSLALKNDGTAVAWGDNTHGATNIPAGLSNALAIDGGWYGNLALKTDGTVVAWGDNTFFQMNVPAGLNNVVAIAVGNGHDVALKSDGSLVAWGDNTFFQTNIPGGLNNVVAIAAGDGHSLALKSNGTVTVWGDDNYLQQHKPTDLSNVVAVAGGNIHSAALKSDGTVVAWYNNAAGQTNVPAGLNDAMAIAAGGNFNLALKSNGTVVAWGDNTYGQRNVPGGLSSVVAVFAGAYHSLALKEDGTLIGWGHNNANEIIIPAGLNTLNCTTNSSVNTNGPGTYLITYSCSNAIGGITTATRTVVVKDTVPPVITVLGSNLLTNVFNTPFVDPGATNLDACGGSFTLSTNGNVNPNLTGTYLIKYSATDNYGNSATNTRTVVVNGAPVVTTLNATGVSNAVATLKGSVIPGGLATAWFEWGTAANNYSFTTAAVSVGGGALPVAVSDVLSGLTPGLIYHYRAVASNSFGVTPGQDVLFGSPAFAFSGGTTITNECHVVFTDPGVTASDPVLAIGAGDFFGLTVKSDGTVIGWGRNNSNQITIPAGLSNVVAVTGGSQHSLALKADGTVVSWGANGQGQTIVPAGLSNVVAIAGGSQHSLALKSDGTMVGWGNGIFGLTSTPAGLSNVVAIAAGGLDNVALKSDGTVSEWGEASLGQTNIPAGLSNVIAIAMGNAHSLALKDNGTVVAWAYNNSGQATVPANLSNVVAVAAGGYHSLALKSDGTVVGWGANTFGQRTIPAGLSNVVAIAAGVSNSLALKSDGTIIAWGNNTYGQTNIPAALNTLNCITNGGVNVNFPGTYPLQYASSNSLGGTATATRLVVVKDTTPPVITLLGSNPLTNVLNVPFADPGANDLDACGGTFAMSTNSDVNLNLAGTYFIKYSATDNYGNSATNTRTVIVPAESLVVPSLLTGGTKLGNGDFQFSFTNQPGVSFTVFFNTNVALPFNLWSNLGPAIEISAGQYQFTDPGVSTNGQRFYRVRSP